MAGAALACLGALMAFSRNAGQVAERGAAGHEQHSEEENGDWSLLKGKRGVPHWSRIGCVRCMKAWTLRVKKSAFIF
jgi:hypothetical protein